MCSGTSSLRQRRRSRAGTAGSRGPAHRPSSVRVYVRRAVPRWMTVHGDRLVPARPARPRPSGARDRARPRARPRRAGVRARRRACSAAASPRPRGPRSCSAACASWAPRCASAAAAWSSAHGRPEDELPALAREAGAEAVLLDERRRRRSRGARPARDRRAGAAGVEARPPTGGYCVDDSAGRARGAGKPYTVFSPFSRAWPSADAATSHGAPRALPPLPRGAAARPPAVARGARAARRRAATPVCAPGEAAARERAAALARRAGRRTTRERHDRLAGGTSRALAVPALGLPLARASSRSARARTAARGAAAFVRQLRWRDFYAHVLLHHPGNARARAPGALSRRARVGRRRRSARGLAGGAHRLSRSSTPAMRQLRATRLDAQPRPARRRLVPDEGPAPRLARAARRGSCAAAARRRAAQNNGNWQWIASVGVDPAPVLPAHVQPRAPAATPRPRRRVRAPLGARSCATSRSSASPSRGR